jgi:uncharacterized membrane-anchored protein
LSRTLRGWLSNVHLSKVPEIFVLFWVTKVLTTGMGEATSDYLVKEFPRVVAVLIGLVAFAVAHSPVTEDDALRVQ